MLNVQTVDQILLNAIDTGQTSNLPKAYTIDQMLLKAIATGQTENLPKPYTIDQIIEHDIAQRGMCDPDAIYASINNGLYGTEE